MRVTTLLVVTILVFVSTIDVSKSEYITYPAERAFRSTRDQASPVIIDDKYVMLYDSSYITFSVHVPEDGVYPVDLAGHQSNNIKGSFVDVHVNGILLLEKESLILDDNITTHSINLRTGLNTISYSLYGESVAVDWIGIKGGSPQAVNGATLPYEEIEAEAASYQGTLIGPGRQYYTLPSEASGREAVQFARLGDYVEFTPTKSFNAIVVRLSIPDTSSGSGQNATLKMLVNGVQQYLLNVTSHFSWIYGNYPYTKNPSDGKPHHFYDDSRMLFSSTYPAGTKIRLVGGSPTSYTVDLAEFYTVPPPYTIPANYLSVTDYGADPSGRRDSYNAFTTAINTATSSSKGVWIPKGTYSLSSRITSVNKVTIRGAGTWYSELHGLDFGFFGNGAPNPSTGVGLYDFAIFGYTRVRVDSEISQGAGGALSNSVVQNVWIEHNKCGIWVDGPFTGLHVTGVTIRNTFADGINFHQGVTNSMVEQSMIRNTGDDIVAMWAQAPGTYQNNVVQFNTLTLPMLSNTIAIYGGSGNSATDNYCADTVANGAGIQVGTRYGSVSLAGTTTFARNVLVRTGSPNVDDSSIPGEGAIWIYSDGGPITTGNVVFQQISITDSYYQAVMFYQGSISNINFTNIQVANAAYLWEERVPGSVYAQGVVATGLSQAGIWNCGAQFTITQGSGNSGWSSTKCVRS